MTYWDKLIQAAKRDNTDPFETAQDNCPDDLYESAEKPSYCPLKSGAQLSEHHYSCAMCWSREELRGIKDRLYDKIYELTDVIHNPKTEQDRNMKPYYLCEIAAIQEVIKLLHD